MISSSQKLGYSIQLLRKLTVFSPKSSGFEEGWAEKLIFTFRYHSFFLLELFFL